MERFLRGRANERGEPGGMRWVRWIRGYMFFDGRDDVMQLQCAKVQVEKIVYLYDMTVFEG